MIRIACEYNIKEDIEFILDSERINYSALAEKTDALPSKTEGAIRYSLPDFGRVNSYDDAESLESSEITARVDKYQANEMTK